MSELRQDPASGEWVIIAPSRSGRPHIATKNNARPKTKCPFDDPEASGNWPPSLGYFEKGKWQVLVIPNKFPALAHPKSCPAVSGRAPFVRLAGAGFHELVLTRDHKKNFPKLSKEMSLRVFEAFANRFEAASGDPCLNYVSVFGNWGSSTGASLPHPHYQLIALPVVPADVARSLEGSRKFFGKERKCVHCLAIRGEKQAKARLVAENDVALAFAPYASWNAYEVKIYPKRHIAAFESSPRAELAGTAELLQVVLRKMEKNLKSPDNNFFIHTSPLRGSEDVKSYHWHIEVVPKLSIIAGFELATGMDINAVPPEIAAKILRR
jgi:UDPglucose--hexose-1-phosphate uridylyltransferase